MLCHASCSRSVCVYVDYDIDCKHSEMIRKNYQLLVEKLDTQSSGLTGELFSRGVLSLSEKSELDAIQSSTRRAERLLLMLSRGPSSNFREFLSALNETGQHEIAENVNTPSSRE